MKRGGRSQQSHCQLLSPLATAVGCYFSATVKLPCGGRARHLDLGFCLDFPDWCFRSCKVPLIRTAGLQTREPLSWMFPRSRSPRPSEEHLPQEHRAACPRMSSLGSPYSCCDLPKQGLMSSRHQTLHSSQQNFFEPQMLEKNLAMIFPGEGFSWRLSKHWVSRDKHLRGVRAESREGWDSPITFLCPAPARILSNTLLLLPQKVWVGCAEIQRARQGQDWKILCVQVGGQSRCICHLGSGELSWKSISHKPHRQIHGFYLSLLVLFLLIPPP